MSCFRTLCETSQISYRMIRRQERSCTRLLLFPASIYERHQDSSACLHTASACCQNRSAPINCVRRLQRYVAPQVPAHKVFEAPHSALRAGQSLWAAVAQAHLNLGLAQQRPKVGQKMAQESALEVVKVGRLAVAVADSDIGHRNASLGRRLKHTQAHRVGQHAVGGAPLGEHKRAAVLANFIEQARNNALARLRARAAHPYRPNGLCGPPNKRKPLEFSGSHNRRRAPVVAQKNIEVGGVVAQQQRRLVGQLTNSVHL